MEINGIRAEDSWMKGRCPFCSEKIGLVAGMKRKIKKVCYCPKCHKRIDERHIVYKRLF